MQKETEAKKKMAMENKAMKCSKVQIELHVFVHCRKTTGLLIFTYIISLYVQNNNTITALLMN